MRPMEHTATPRLTATIILSSKIAGQVVAVVGALVLFGWAIGNEAITRLHASLASMKPNTALCLVLCGCALWGVNHARERRLLRAATTAAALLVIAIAGTTLLEYVVDHALLGLDQWLFAVRGGLYPGRMAQVTASLFLVAGVALLGIDIETSGGLRPAQGLAMVMIVVALVAVLGYLFGAPSLYAVRPYSSVALHTALSFVLLALGILAARPNAGLMQRLTGDTGAGLVGRRLIPLVVVIPVVVAWLRIWGQHAGLYDTEFGTALHATASVLLLVLLTWWTVGALWRRELVRDRMQFALANSEQDLSITLNSIGDAVIATDLAGRITRMNPVAEKLTGWSLAEVRGHALETVFRIQRSDEPAASQESVVTRVLREGRVVGLADHTVLVARDGAELPIADSGAAIRTEDGELRGVVVVFRDLTGEHRQELMRQRIERALHLAEARNSAILASAVDGIIAMDAAGTIIEFNPSAERIFRTTRELAMGRHVAEVVVPQRLRPALAAAVARAPGDGAAPVFGRAFQQAALRGDGSEFPAEFVLAQVEGVQPPVYTAFVRDISERLRSESERERLNLSLRQRVAEVEAANRELDSFAYVASHDLRSPLRDILSLSAWVAEDSGGLLAPASLQHLAKLQSRAARMERLLDDLLEYSRIGRVAPRTEDVRVGDLIDDALDLVGPRAGFATRVSGGDAVIHSPRSPLVHTLRNLVNNAIKHHHRNSGTIDIEVAPAGNGLLRFTVGDDGPGIAMEYHDVVFQPFRTLRRRDEVEGSGLGLAIVRKMVESVGGRVEIQSAPGAGTRISFTWPERWVPPVRDLQEWEAQPAERIAS